MDCDKIFQLINQVAFFNKFTEEEKKIISRLDIPILLYHSGEVIIRQDDMDASLFILLKGSVSVIRNEEPGVTIKRLKAGSVFGEMSFLGNRPRSTNIVAEDGEVVALKIDKQRLDETPTYLANKFKDQFILILINRLDEMTKNMAKLIRH